MSSFASFRNQNNDINSLREKFNKLNGKTNNNQLDETYWTTDHVRGAEGKGEAVVRFLPAPPDGNGGQEPDNIVKYFQYSINKDGKWYINRGRNSINANEPDPANDYNKSIWARKDLTKDQKLKLLANRNIFYIANIYVVKDPNKPENEGKVFRWQFGPQIYNLINAQLFPEFETDTPVNVFDPIEGADFNFRVITKSIPDRNTGQLRNVPSYENSKFSSPSARWTIENFDDVWHRQYSLQSEVSEDKFSSYEDLKRQWDRVMGNPSDRDEDDEIPVQQSKKPIEQKSKPQTTAEAIDDELPWINDDKSSDDSFTVEETKTDGAMSSDDIDDWFNNLGK